MSLKSRFILLCSLALVLATAVAFTAFLLSSHQRKVTGLMEMREQAPQLMGDLRNLSDDLTRLARSYVGTGSHRYRTLHDSAVAILTGIDPKPANATGRIYWEHVLADDPSRLPRTGSALPRAETFASLGANAEEAALLRTAEQRIGDQVRTERQAFAFFDGLYPGAPGTTPQPGAPDPEQAQRILHNHAYNEAKLAIMSPLDQLENLFPARMDAELADHRRHTTKLANLLLALTGALGAVLVAGFALIHVRMISPLARLAALSQSMARGNTALRAPAETGGEVGALARSFNQLVDRIYSNDTELKLQMNEIGRLKTAVASQSAALEDAGRSAANLQAELQTANAFKLRLLGLASHNLKAPLAEVETLSGVIAADLGDQPVASSQLERIRASAHEMHSMIVDMLDIAARDLGQVSLERTTVNTFTLLRDVLDQLNPAARQKQQVISLFHEGDCSVTADARRLRQVFENLIDNAIKFSPRGKPIALVLQGDDHSLRFSVCDEGPGLTAEDRNHLFGYFQRLSARPTGGESSNGLGLALCKQIIELHGGRIGVESDGPGTGTKFWIELPRTVLPLN